MLTAVSISMPSINICDSSDTGKVDLTMNIVERKSGGGISGGGGISSGCVKVIYLADSEMRFLSA